MGSLLGGNVWILMVKLLCGPKRKSGFCLLMHISWRASRSVVACGSVVVMLIPSMLCILGVFSGVRIRTFLVEMMCMISYLVIYLARSGGNGWVIGMFCFQHARRAKKIRKPRWRKVSLFSYSSWPRRERGPIPSIRNSRRSFMELMLGVVMLRNLVMVGRLGMLWRACVGPLRRSDSLAYR